MLSFCILLLKVIIKVGGFLSEEKNGLDSSSCPVKNCPVPIKWQDDDGASAG
jgi:hypothetical protein